MRSSPEKEESRALQKRSESTLYEVTSGPLPPFDLKEELGLLLERAVEGLGIALGFIGLCDNEPGPLRVFLVRQFGVNYSSTEVDALCQCPPARRAIVDQQVIYISPAEIKAEPEIPPGLHEVIYAPVSGSGKIVGLLCLGNPQGIPGWGGGMLDVARELAHQVGLTWQMARTYSQLSNCLGTDPRAVDAMQSLSTLWQGVNSTYGQLVTGAWRVNPSLKAADLKFQSLFESARDPVVIIQGGRFRYVNHRLTEVLGFSAEECYKMGGILEVIMDRHRAVVAETHRQQLQGKLAPPHEFIALHKNGTEVLLEAFGTLIQYEGRPALQEIWRNVTPQRQLRAQLLLSEKLAALGQLVSGVAHELNNPLTTVLGLSELVLTNSQLSDELRLDLKTIAGEAHRARKIVQNLLAFAYSPDSEKRLINVNEALNDTLELREYELRMNNVEVVRILDPDLPPVIADVDQLKQVFLNIIINAEQALIGTQRRGSLEVKTGSKTSSVASGSAHWVEIRFRDDGPGIPPENLSRIFDSFFTTKEVGKGTGLGLAISSSIIKDHGGRIYAQNLAGRGAEFVIELPAQAAV